MSGDRQPQSLMLFNSILKGDISSAIAHLRHGANPSYVLSEGAAPIHIAVGIDDSNLSKNITKLLLQYGADPNVRSAEGLTPMHIAATYGRSENLALLINHGGDPRLKDMDGQTVLDSTTCSLCCDVLRKSTLDVEEQTVRKHSNATTIVSPTSYYTCSENENSKMSPTQNGYDYPTLNNRKLETKPQYWNGSSRHCEVPNYQLATKRNTVRSEAWVIPVEELVSKAIQPRRPKSEALDFRHKLKGRQCNNQASSHTFNSRNSMSCSDNLNQTYVVPRVQQLSDQDDTSDDSDHDNQYVPEEDTVIGLNHKTYLIDSSAEVTTSEGDVTNSEGDVTSSEGDVTSSEGDVTNSEGDVSRSECDVTRSEGDETRSEGDETSSEGDVTRSEGDATSDESDLTSSEGDMTHGEYRSSEFEFDAAELPSVNALSGDNTNSGIDFSVVSVNGNLRKSVLKDFKNKRQLSVNNKNTAVEELEGSDHLENDKTFLISSDESRTDFQTVIHIPRKNKLHSITEKTSLITSDESQTDFQTDHHIPRKSKLQSITYNSPTVKYNLNDPTYDDSICSVTNSTFRPVVASTSIDSDSDISEESCYVSAVAPDQISLKKHLDKLHLNSSIVSVQSTGSQCSCHARAEETIITDEEDGFSLVEVHLIPEECICSTPSPDCAHPLSKATSPHCFVNNSADSTLLYDWKDRLTDKETESEEERPSTVPQEIAALTNCQLRSNLLDLGDNPGPILPSTRQQYEMRLVRLRKDPGLIKLSSHTDQEFLPELAKALEGNLDLSSVHGLEEQMNKVFGNADPKKHWREGTKKASFIYLLLDPRVTQNLPLRSKHISHEEGFKAFVRAVFYVGKGKSARPYCHFKEAIKHYNMPQLEPGAKVQQIQDIWTAGLGVVSLHVFQNTIPVEAYTREACIIEAFGLSRLTNKCKGQLYGPATKWSKRELRILGVRLLKKAYHILLFEGERQIKPHDVKTK